MRRRMMIGALLIVGSHLGTMAAVAEVVESPIYRRWARFPIGTTIVQHSVTENKQAKLETTLRYTLVELDKEKAVIELVKTEGGSADVEPTAPLQYTYQRDFLLLPGVKKEDIGKPSGAIARGEETITVAGKEYKAQWYDTKGQTEAGPSLSRTWISEEVPGKVLKTITRVEAASNTTTVELLEIRIP